MFTQEDLELFDDFVLSYEVKMTKPDPGIFELAASRLEVEPTECLFIDDIERYCIGAKDVGMHAINYKNFGQMCSEMEQILKVTNPDK